MRAAGRGAVLAAVRLVLVVAAIAAFAAWWSFQKQPDFRLGSRLRLLPDTSAVAPGPVVLRGQERPAWTLAAGQSLRLSFTVPGEDPVLRFLDGRRDAGAVLAVRQLSAGGAPEPLERHEAREVWTQWRVPLRAEPGQSLTVELEALPEGGGGPVCVADLVLESAGRGVDETEAPIVTHSTTEDLLGRTGEPPVAAPATGERRRAGLDGPPCVELERGVPLSVETSPLPPLASLELVLHVANPWPDGLTSAGRVVVSVEDRELAAVPVELPEGELSVETLTRIDLSAWAGRPLLVSLGCEGAETLFVGVADLSVHAPQSVPRAGNLERKGVNVLLVLVDALRPDRLGCAGWAGASTPALDALAARGGRYARVLCPSSWTLPNLGTALTGVSPLSHGLGQTSRGVLDTRLPTLAQTAAWSGMTTACFSSSDELSARTGLERGYETQVGEPLAADLLVERALDWLADAQQFRWFLTLHLADLGRQPYDPSEESLARLPPGGPPAALADALRRLDSRPGAAEALAHEVGTLYDAELSAVDRALGALLDGLAREGVLEQTLVAVVGTSGEEFYEHNGRLRGQTLFDEVVCVPAILAGPGVRGPDGGPFVEARAIELADVVRLLAHLGQLSSQAGLQGRFPPPFAPADPDQVCHAVLRPYPGTTALDLDASRSGRWLTVRDNRTGARSLYDLERDPGATDNLLLARDPAALALAEELQSPAPEKVADVLQQRDVAVRRKADELLTAFANWHRACARAAASSPRLLPPEAP